MSIASKLKELAISMGAEFGPDDDSIEEILAKMKGHTSGGEDSSNKQAITAEIDPNNFDYDHMSGKLLIKNSPEEILEFYKNHIPTILVVHDLSDDEWDAFDAGTFEPLFNGEVIYELNYEQCGNGNSYFNASYSNLDVGITTTKIEAYMMYDHDILSSYIGSNEYIDGYVKIEVEPDTSAGICGAILQMPNNYAIYYNGIRGRLISTNITKTEGVLEFLRLKTTNDGLVVESTKIGITDTSFGSANTTVNTIPFTT